MRCSHCNSELKKNMKFCPECGMSVIWVDDFHADGRKSGNVKLATTLITVLIIAGIVAFLAPNWRYWINGTTAEIALEATETSPEEVVASPIAFSDDPTAILEASQSVVKLNCYDKAGELYATGSGFACFADNVIVTNYHVIKDAYNIEASTEDGNTFNITYVLATDKAKDIAILGTSTPHNLALLQPGNSDCLQKGEKVVAIGSPLGLLNTVSTGVFSGYIYEDGINVLQFTASISNGSSGGALFNNAGEVLGITSASYEAGQNLNLAIPIEQAEAIYSNIHFYVDRITIEKFYASNIERPFICNVKTKTCHVNRFDGCYDAMRGELSIKYSGNGDEYLDGEREFIYLTLSDATALGYTMCPKCE